MCGIREKEIGAMCAELDGFLEKLRAHVNVHASELHQSYQ